MVGPGRRFPFGLPRTDNANYLWIQLFHSALNAKGRAGFVMANSASDARGSELVIRRQLIEARAVDVMVAVGPNFFYTVTLPCTLWFFDKSKRKAPRADRVLFVDARHLYRQIDRAHRDWTPAQIEFLANIARLYRREQPDNLHDSAALMAEHFGKKLKYADLPGLCKVATLAEIEAQGWSLNPGRYVGVAARAEEDFNFKERLEEQNEELETLKAEARELEKSSARLFPPFSVMMTSRATLGVISINTTAACTNQGFITCVPNKRFPLYTLYYWVKENVEYFISLGTGATFKEITKGVFKTIELVVPARAIVTQFENTVQQFALQILNLQRKNTTLRRTRDLLLPRLISGEVDVSELDITVPEEAAV
jgi:hypothetical protein